MTILASLILALLLAAICAVVPYGARSIRTSIIIGIMGAGLALAILGGLFALGPYPWTDLLALVLALSAGLWLGRGLSANPGTFLIVLGILSALDILQIVLTGMPVHSASNSMPPAAALYGNFFLLVPWGHFNIGIFDLFLIAAMAEVWRIRGGPYLLALLPGALGLILAYAFLFIYQGAIPLIPFLTLGWLASLGLQRLRDAQPQTVQPQENK